MASSQRSTNRDNDCLKLAFQEKLLNGSMYFYCLYGNCGEKLCSEDFPNSMVSHFQSHIHTDKEIFEELKSYWEELRTKTNRKTFCIKTKEDRKYLNLRLDPKRKSRASSFSLSKIESSPIFSQLFGKGAKTSEMYFIIPPGETEQSCSDGDLGITFKTAQFHQIRVKWIEDDDCEHMQLTGNGNVIVFQSFSSSGYKYWEREQQAGTTGYTVEILGTQVLKYIFTSQEVLPFKTNLFPTFTLAMRNMTVLLTGFEEPEKRELAKKVKWMNGEICSGFTRSITHVVTNSALASENMVAKHQNLPVMKAEWIREVWKGNQEGPSDASDDQYRNYACPTFYNINVCFSQFGVDGSTRERSLQKVITRLGGNYHKKMMQTTDVLVLTRPTGAEYNQATDWKVPCVLPLWIDQSQAKARALPFEDFKVEGPKNAPRIQTSTPDHSITQGSFHASLQWDSFPPNIERVPTSTNVIRPISELAGSAPTVSNTAETTGEDDDESDETQWSSSTRSAREASNASDESATGGIFAGHSFFIGSENIEERTHIKAVIKQHGGKVSKPENVADFGILPTVFKPQQVHKAVAKYTKYWLDECVKRGCLIVSTTDDEFYFKPNASYGSMGKVLKDTVITASQYSNVPRNYIRELVAAMGGRYQDQFSRTSVNTSSKSTLKSTHLICYDTSSTEKAKAARKWDVPLVTVGWLLHSCANRTRELESTYHPNNQPSQPGNDTIVLTPTPRPRTAAKVIPSEEIPPVVIPGPDVNEQEEVEQPRSSRVSRVPRK